MNCKEFQELITEILSEPGAAPLPSELQDHLAACAECREAEGALRGLFAELQAATVSDPGEVFFQRQLRLIEAGIREPSSRPLWRRLWAPALAAAAVLAVLIGYSNFFRSTGDWQKDWPVVLSWLAQDQGDEGRWLELDDLGPQELDVYARTVEAQVMTGEIELEDEFEDFQELDGQETELLIKRLQAGLKDRAS